MFSLHVDTARTWRGGQSQVRLTVHGLHAMGQRVALVAHPSGELRRRVDAAIELVPLAPRSELDLLAAWRFSRVIRQLAPDVIHAHDPHAVAMAALALRIGSSRNVSGTAAAKAPALVASRRVDFHLKRNPLSRWKYRQVDCFVTASEAIRQMLVADGVSAKRTVTVHEGTDVELEKKSGGVFMKAASLRLPTPEELARVAGCLKYNGPPKTIEEMDRAVGDAFRRKWKK